MKENNSTSTGGVGLVGLVFVAFLVLKLCKVINWSWWWVSSPLWITALVFVVALIVCFVNALASSKRGK